MLTYQTQRKGGRDKYNVIVIHSRDNVGVALAQIRPGEKAEADGLEHFLFWKKSPPATKLHYET